MDLSPQRPGGREPGCSEELAERLWACPRVQNREERKLLLRYLTDEIGSPVVNREDLDGWPEVLAVAKTCCEEASGRYLEKLAHVVLLFEKKSVPARDLKDYVDSLLGIVGADELEELLGLLPDGGPSPEAVYSLYARSVDVPEPMNRIGGLPGIIRHLNDLPLQAGLAFPYPLLAFVERIALRLDRERAASLRAWVERTAQKLPDIPEGSLVGLRAQLQAELIAPLHPHLMILLEPSAVDQKLPVTQKTYALRAWLFDDRNEIDYTFPPVQETIKLDKVDEALDQWRAPLAGLLGQAMTQLTIEVFVPRELLNLRADHWKLTISEGLKVSVGKQYRLVIRSLERQRDKRALPTHLAKWQSLLQSNPDTAASSIWWFQEADREELYVTLVGEDDRVGVGLAFRHPQIAERNDLLYISLQAGVPVALWLREKVRDGLQRLRAELEAKLSSDGLSDLPGLVRDLRASTAMADVCRHLALLWDDPHRPLPEGPPLHAPRATREDRA